MQFSFERDQQDASSASMSFVLRSQEIFRVGVCFGVNLPERKFYLHHTRILMFQQPPPVQTMTCPFKYSPARLAKYSIVLPISNSFPNRPAGTPFPWTYSSLNWLF